MTADRVGQQSVTKSNRAAVPISDLGPRDRAARLHTHVPPRDHTACDREPAASKNGETGPGGSESGQMKLDGNLQRSPPQHNLCHQFGFAFRRRLRFQPSSISGKRRRAFHPPRIALCGLFCPAHGHLAALRSNLRLSAGNFDQLLDQMRRIVTSYGL